MILALFAAAVVQAGPPKLVLDSERGAYEAMLTKQAREADAFFGGGPCLETSVKKIGSQPVTITSRPDLAAGAEHLQATGCGRTTTININVVRYGGTPPWKMVTGLPGDTLAGFELQQSTWPKALAEAGADLGAPCQEVRMADAYVSARPGHIDIVGAADGQKPPTPGRLGIELPTDAAAQRDKFDMSLAWAEVWPLTLCGQDRTLSIIFIPRKDEASSFLLFLPIWRAGPEARPTPAAESQVVKDPA